MNPISLSPDCSRCASLCCITLAFDKSNKFAINKEAGEPCPNLAVSGLCKIHKNLEDRGFEGCIQFNCHGAGQRVTQEVFGGKSWQQDITLLQPMSEAFRPMRLIHDLLQLLESAGKLPLSRNDIDQHTNLVQALNPSEGWTVETLNAFETGPLKGEVMSFFSSLDKYISNKKTG